VALAVSGGSDSTALMVLFAEWLAHKRRSAESVTVLTVDHGLRPGSAAEAKTVALHSAAFGFEHVTLVWSGPKPTTGIQDAARRARYRLIADYARAHGVSMVLTGHTADDQAETLLMRLARGSGLDGLSGIAPIHVLDAQQGPPGASRIELVRPLLGIARARLQATLRARGISWLEDPSNAWPVFERARLRAAKAERDKLGLTNDSLALTARRLQRARAALENAVAVFVNPAAGAVRIDPCGFYRIDRARLRTAPAEIALRVLVRAIAAAGGAGEPVPLAKAEAINEAVQGEGVGSFTLGRAVVTATPSEVVIEREPGREPLPALVLSPGGCALWDGRFWVQAAPSLDAPVEVRPLGERGLKLLREAGARPAKTPHRVMAAVPAFWRGETLVAVPAVGYWLTDEARPMLSAAFAGFELTVEGGEP
jgi:tRNA(Ile)-lysidine synthase